MTIDPTLLDDRNDELVVHLDIFRLALFGLTGMTGRLGLLGGGIAMLARRGRLGTLGCVIPGLRRRAQEQSGADPAAKADQREKNGKDFAQHGQNGITMSATCWP